MGKARGLACLAICFICVSTNGLAKNHSSATAHLGTSEGIIVAYGEDLTDAQRQEALRLASVNGFESVYFADKIFAEHFKAKLRENASKDSALCESLRSLPFIKACDLNLRLKRALDVSHEMNSSESVESATPAASTEVSASSVSKDTCGLVPGGAGKTIKVGLSKYWAQTYIGRDLAQKMFCEGSNGKHTSSAVEVWDEGGGDPLTGINHPDQVAFLIDDPTHGSKLECGTDSPNNVRIRDVGKSEMNSALLKFANDVARRRQRTVVNMSLGDIVNATYLSFPKNQVSVVAAGNEWPDFEPVKEAHKEVLFVGSLSPAGLPSDFSSSFSNVAIAAPSDNYIQSKDIFGGTSGATPVVAGAVSTLLEILPGISVADIKSMLAKTALPSPHRFETPPLDGTGTLNFPGIVSFANRIAKACADSGKAQAACIHDRIKTLSAFENKLDARVLSEAKSAFGCGNGSSPQSSGSSSTCSVQAKALDELRRAAYLNPEVAPYWQTLGCIYKKIGYTRDADFYDSLAFRGWPASASTIALNGFIENRARSLKDTSDFVGLLRMQPTLSHIGLGNDEARVQLLQSLYQSGGSKLVQEAVNGKDTGLSISAYEVLLNAYDDINSNEGKGPLSASLLSSLLTKKTSAIWMSDTAAPFHSPGQVLTQAVSDGIVSYDELYLIASRHIAPKDPLRGPIVDLITRFPQLTSQSRFMNLVAKFIETSTPEERANPSSVSRVMFELARSDGGKQIDLVPFVVKWARDSEHGKVRGYVMMSLSQVNYYSASEQSQLISAALVGLGDSDAFTRIESLEALNRWAQTGKPFGQPGDREAVLRQIERNESMPPQGSVDQINEYAAEIKQLKNLLNGS